MRIPRLALLHAGAELGGLGGAVHLRRFPSRLQLVATQGLPSADARAWETLGEGSAGLGLAVVPVLNGDRPDRRDERRSPDPRALRLPLCRVAATDFASDVGGRPRFG
ncbi:hypothetical protein FB570_109200 [Streptomyces sp. T12]|nr:hypothetical protein FB570_109200 [Streptomyces sp. T12]